MLLIIENLSHFLICHFWLCSSDVSSESLFTQEKQSTRLFLTFIICHVDSWVTRLRVFSTTVIELNKFIELRKFVNFKEFIKSAELENSKELKNYKNVQLYLNASEYLNDLFL